MNKNLLLLHDFTGYGKVALSAMIPILSHMHYEVFNLPTAIVSNTLDYGRFEILDTTQYMQQAVEIWDRLGFRFAAVSIGFLASNKQAEFVAGFAKEQSGKGAVIFTDPILGDSGRLYNGMTEKNIAMARTLLSVSDYCVPNATEAAYLADIPYKADGFTEEEIRRMLHRLRALGAKNIIITSAKREGAAGRCVIGFDDARGEPFQVDYEEIPAQLPGTGDIFSAILTGKVMAGLSLCDAVSETVTTVGGIIADHIGSMGKYLPVEDCLKEIR